VPIIQRAGRSLLKVVAATACLVALPAATANADLIETSACDDAALTKPFTPWGDSNWYKLAPGGDFEGAHGWSLKGNARTAAGSSPFAATGDKGTTSVVLPAGASVTSPATCVNAAYPTFRLFAKSSGGLLGLVPLLKAEVLYRDGLLGIIPVPAGVVTLSGSWTPSGAQLTLSALGAAVAGGEAPISIRLTSVLGTWTVDDVFVDPYRRA
jgi:hypothetical protein